jgi:hypothetical protein
MMSSRAEETRIIRFVGEDKGVCVSLPADGQVVPCLTMGMGTSWKEDGKRGLRTFQRTALVVVNRRSWRFDEFPPMIVIKNVFVASLRSSAFEEFLSGLLLNQVLNEDSEVSASKVQNLWSESWAWLRDDLAMKLFLTSAFFASTNSWFVYYDLQPHHSSKFSVKGHIHSLKLPW